MGSHPANLGLRFLLELAALIAAAWWMWQDVASPWRLPSSLAIPVVLATVWGVFAVPEDPSRSGRAPVPVPGWVRLAIELSVFAIGTLAWHRVAGAAGSRVFAGLVVLHYAASYDRISWLLAGPGRSDTGG